MHILILTKIIDYRTMPLGLGPSQNERYWTSHCDSAILNKYDLPTIEKLNFVQKLLYRENGVLLNGICCKELHIVFISSM